MKKVLFLIILTLTQLFWNATASGINININQDTFVLSNEGGGLINQLVNVGYGEYNLYQALVQIQNDANPSVAPIITDQFLATLQNCPAGAEIFTTKLKDVSSLGISVSISTDGTARYDTILGSTHYGTFPTLAANISGVGSANFTHSTDPQAPLNSTVIDEPLAGMTTTYNAFAVAWGASEAPSITTQPASTWANAGSSATFKVAASGAPSTFIYHWQRLPKGSSTWVTLFEGSPYNGTNTDSLTVGNTTLAMNGDQFRCTVSNGVSPDATSNAATLAVSKIFVNVNQDCFVLSNEGGGLINQLVSAGYGDNNLYQALVDIAANTNPSVTGLLTPAFMSTLKNAPVFAEIFTTLLKDVSSKGVSVSICTDGTARYDTILGSTHYGTFPTLVANISGVGSANFTHSTDPQVPLNKKLINGPLAGMTTTYNAFGVAWAPGEQTFILSNEGNSLISQLVNAGYGDYNLYQTLVTLQGSTDPSISGILTDEFLATLQSNPGSSPVFTTKLKNVNTPGTSIAISTDGTVQTVSVFGNTYYGQAGAESLGANISGVGNGIFTHSITSLPLTSWISGEKTYNVFAIGWAPGEQTFVLSNEGNGLISQLVNAGYGDYNLYDILLAIQGDTNPAVTGFITDNFLNSLASRPASSAIFTTQLQNLNVGNQGIAISADGTFQVVNISGYTYFGKAGTATQVSDVSGVGIGNFIRSTSVGTPLTSFSANGKTYEVFAIGWAPGSLPTVTTGEILDLLPDSALVIGNVTGDGGLTVTERGVVFSVSENPIIGNGTKVNSASGGNGMYKTNLTTLSPNTKYYTRAFATNSSGTSYGENRSFTTPVKVTTVYSGLLALDIAADTMSNKIYSANFNGDSVSVINGKSDTLMAKIATGKKPQVVAVNTRTNRIYVVNNTGNSVSVINGQSNTLIKNIGVGNSPNDLTVNPVTNKIYVANYSSNNVSVIDGATNNETKITVGKGPFAVGVNTKTNKIYVVNYDDASVTVIDGATNSTSTVVTGKKPRFIAVNDSTNKIFVCNNQDASITVIDGASNLTDTIALESNASPYALAINKKTNKIYVTNTNKNSVTVIDGDTYTTETIATGNAPQAIAINDSTNSIYVGNYYRDDWSNKGFKVSKIDGITKNCVGFPTLFNPEAIVVNPRTNKTYISNGNYVTIIEEFIPILTVSPDTLDVAATEGSTVSFTIKSNINWAVSSDQSWLTLNPKTGTGNGKVTATVKVNSSVSNRMATITVTGKGVDTLSVLVFQSAAAATLDVSPKTLNVSATSGSTGTFNITSNTGWTVSSNQTWLTTSKASGSGNSGITVTAQANPTISERSAIVTISAAGAASKTVTVTQAAGAVLLSVSPNNLIISSFGDLEDSCTITSNTNWTALSDQAWLSVNPMSGTGNGKLTVTAQQNLDSIYRTATVTVSAPGAVSQHVSVRQTFMLALDVSPDTLTVESSEGSKAAFNVTSNVTWSIVADQTWLTVDPGNGKGSKTITVTALANPLVSERIATVTVSAGGVPSKTVTIKQPAGAVTLFVLPSDLKIEANEGSTASFGITSNTTWAASSDQTWLTVNPLGGNGNGMVTITAKANTAATERTATVTVSTSGTDPQSVLVTQAGMVGISVESSSKVLVYPNPFIDGFYVTTGSNPTIVSVYDIRGRLILTHKVLGSEFITAEKLVSGIYLIELVNDLTTIKKKLIKR